MDVEGDYVNLGAGAETGIYKGGEPYWDVAAGDALPMMISLYDKDGNTIFVYDPEDLQWWITGFDPMIQNVKADKVIGSIDFSAPPELWKPIAKAIKMMRSGALMQKTRRHTINIESKGVINEEKSCFDITYHIMFWHRGMCVYE